MRRPRKSKVKFLKIDGNFMIFCITFFLLNHDLCEKHFLFPEKSQLFLEKSMSFSNHLWFSQIPPIFAKNNKKHYTLPKKWVIGYFYPETTGKIFIQSNLKIPEKPKDYKKQKKPRCTLKRSTLKSHIPSLDQKP